MTEFRTDEIFQTLKGLLRVIDNDEKRRQVESYIMVLAYSWYESPVDYVTPVSPAGIGGAGGDR
jgi:hypothetical protein